MNELVNETATLLSEAIVELIENDGQAEIIDKARVAEYRVADEAAPRREVMVYSQRDRARKEPLFVLTVTNSPFATVDEKQLLDGLAERAKARRNNREGLAKS